MHAEKDIRFESEGESLVGTLCEVEENQKGQALILHGAGNATRARTKYLADQLSEGGVSSLRLDFSGHGDSSGDLQESSLEKRVLEAKEAYMKSGFEGPVSVIGSSMSGHIAIKLAELIEVSSLVLYCPAIYPTAAYSVPFNGGFSEIIRRENSWIDSECFDIISRFKGKILILIGTADTVIPAGVINKLEASMQKEDQKVVRLPEATHAIHSWIQEHPEANERVRKMVLECIG